MYDYTRAIPDRAHLPKLFLSSPSSLLRPPPSPSVRASISSIVQSIQPVYIRFRDRRGNNTAEIVEIEGRISRDLLIFDYSTRVEGEEGGGVSVA